MDVTLVHVEQQGSSPRRRRTSQVDSVLDLHDKFARLCGSSMLPMLSRVDPYGTLILSSSEMDQFISEIEVEFLRVEDPVMKDFLKSALRLARECREEEEMKLRLDGD
ncbi:hypothetical protein [Streptomyces luteogriseus]|uniref:hypothetical protein n=1 Tax=Streptomyces luteogriseus TaxID=68233 RepID=UPI002E31C39F|nr:hypothetical protein [Streptomyces luteogriseus]WTJ30490.1 hypothetical protein OID52_27315 [Streptomyces luteogriseus]